MVQMQVLPPSTANKEATLTKKSIEDHPRNIMIKDLTAKIKEWKEEGDSIVLLIDANENVTEGPLAESLAEVGMYEAIMEKYSAT